MKHLKVGSLTFIAGLVTLKLPETLDQPIAQTIAEAEAVARNQSNSAYSTKYPDIIPEKSSENPAYTESETSSL